MKRSEFVEYLLEQLAPLGNVSARPMFGGYGVYLDATIFAIVVNDVLYLKADETSRAKFERRGLEPFRYKRSSGVMTSMSYWRAPADALEDSEELCRWARSACETSLVAVRKPNRKGRKKKGASG